MVDGNGAWIRQSEAFWRAHHEAWKRSNLNQRQYCEAQDIPLKAFGNWRAIFNAEPQPLERKLLYRRRGLSPPLSHPLNHLAYPSSWSESLIVSRARMRAIADASAKRTNAGLSTRRRKQGRRHKRRAVASGQNERLDTTTGASHLSKGCGRISQSRNLRSLRSDY